MKHPLRRLFRRLSLWRSKRQAINTIRLVAPSYSEHHAANLFITAANELIRKRVPIDTVENALHIAWRKVRKARQRKG